MTIRYLTALLVAPMLTITAAQAHEIWIERDGSGPARIYLGEPEAPLPPGGDPEFAKLKAPKLLPASKAQLTRRAGVLEVAVPAGDVRAHDDTVFQPWGDPGKKESVAYFARAGRSEARALLPLEITPERPNSDRFKLVRDGKPVADTDIKVISPDKWTKVIKTDAQGSITVPAREKGRYLLVATQKDEGEFQTGVGPVAVLHRIATTTFVN